MMAIFICLPSCQKCSELIVMILTRLDLYAMLQLIPHLSYYMLSLMASSWIPSYLLRNSFPHKPNKAIPKTKCWYAIRWPRTLLVGVWNPFLLPMKEKRQKKAFLKNLSYYQHHLLQNGPIKIPLKSLILIF